MTRARELSKLGNPNIFSVDSNLNVGVGSLTPDTKLDVIGVVSATSFYGDGSGITGIAATADVSTSSLVVVGISTLGNVTAGVVTATSFSGDGSGLTGLNIPTGFTELDASLFN